MPKRIPSPNYRIFHEISRYSTVSNQLVNIGANDGRFADPLYPVLQRFPATKYVGFEPHDEFFNLEKNLQEFPKAHAFQQAITPTNARSTLTSAGVKNPDILKIDTDGCDCHILQALMTDPLLHAKVIQIELNHIIPPPIVYMDMCEADVWGRSSKTNLDVWGCSMQAAYDIVRGHDYTLLQYDWPDAVFIHSSLLHLFPCIAAESEDSFHRNYWTGFFHAKENYSRFRDHVTNTTFVQEIELLALRSYLHPRSTLEHIISTQSLSWTKDPLWIELAISGSSVSAQIKRQGAGALRVNWAP